MEKCPDGQRLCVCISNTWLPACTVLSPVVVTPLINTFPSFSTSQLNSPAVRKSIFISNSRSRNQLTLIPFHPRKGYAKKIRVLALPYVHVANGWSDLSYSSTPSQRKSTSCGSNNILQLLHCWVRREKDLSCINPICSCSVSFRQYSHTSANGCHTVTLLWGTICMSFSMRIMARPGRRLLSSRFCSLHWHVM